MVSSSMDLIRGNSLLVGMRRRRRCGRWNGDGVVGAATVVEAHRRSHERGDKVVLVSFLRQWDLIGDRS